MTICIVTFKVWDEYDLAYNPTLFATITRKYPQKLNNKYLTKFDFCTLVLAELPEFSVVEAISVVEKTQGEL